MLERRDFTAWAGFGFISAVGLTSPRKVQAKASDTGGQANRVWRELQALERHSRARLGVHIVDTASGASYSHRPDERFLMCSTVKLLIAAEVLRRVDRGQESMQRRIHYGRKVLIDHSPVTEKHTKDGMTLAELCDAAMTVSDNAAANLLLASFGGPPRITTLARELRDTVTRLDNDEPKLNRLRPGDPRNTTSPRAMAGNLQRLLLGDALSAASRAQLLAWMQANTTGNRLLRAGLRSEWTVGDKTGGGERTRNDVAIIAPVGRAPWLVTAYLTDSRGTADERDASLAEVGRVVASLIG